MSISDACPAGMGGYSHKGFAWQFYLPDDLKFRASNNLLEHMAGIISPWVDILAGHLNTGDCSLSMTDSTTSKGWMRKTNFKEDKNGIQATIRIEVAQSHMAGFMDHGIREYSQWFRGIENNMADALSQDMDRSDDELTQIYFTHVPSQVPNSLKIVPLPNKIVSWVTLLLQRLPVQLQYSKEHTKTTLGCGDDGKNTANPQASKKIYSLSNSQSNTEDTFSVVSPWLCMKEDFQDRVMLPWLQAQSVVPSATWQQPSGVTDTRICHMTNMEL
jgi:hypothetical protein